MICKVCNYDDNNNSEFVGIFAPGVNFLTTNSELCGLFGCPNCHTVQFVTDLEYIERRKLEYKKKVKSLK